jgi:ubiquinone/menaquinone biosynthesis C-methylase UbiE
MTQFGHPRGFLGRVVGIVMAYENRERNQWAVSVLNAQPNDRILEIGFGPGFAIRHLTQTTTAKFVAGVDDSLVMVQQARKRNVAAIRRGQVELQHGSVAQLPYPDATFDIVFAVNSFHHWPDPATNLHEVWRVLRPGGLVAITEQPRDAVPDESVRARGQELAGFLATVGFHDIRLEFKPMRPATSICVLGTK